MPMPGAQKDGLKSPALRAGLFSPNIPLLESIRRTAKAGRVPYETRTWRFAGNAVAFARPKLAC